MVERGMRTSADVVREDVCIPSASAQYPTASACWKWKGYLQRSVELFAVVPRRGVRRTFVCTYPKFTSENGNAFTHARTFPPAIKAQFEEVESPPGGA